MKIFYACLFCLVLLTLLFFSLYGDALYESGKPIVTTVRMVSVAGQEGIIVPTDAVHYDSGGAYVYRLRSERGYSRVIYTAYRVDVEIIAHDSDSGTTVVKYTVNTAFGDSIIVVKAGEIKDGGRVLLR